MYHIQKVDTIELGSTLPRHPTGVLTEPPLRSLQLPTEPNGPIGPGDFPHIVRGMVFECHPAVGKFVTFRFGQAGYRDGIGHFSVTSV